MENLKLVRNTLLVICLFITFFSLAVSISKAPASSNDISRLGGIIAVARYDKLNFDDTLQSITSDKVCYENKCYSSKPPVLNFVTGNALKLINFVKPELLNNDLAIYKISTILLTVIPLYVLYIFFVLYIRINQNLGLKSAIIWGSYLIFGTLLFVYSKHLNNHILETLSQLLVYFFLFNNHKQSRLNNFFLGFFLSLAFVCDVTFGLIVVGVTFIYLILTNIVIIDLAFIIIGFLPLTILHLILSYLQFNTIIPPQLMPEVYLNYTGSRWIGNAKRGIEALNESVLVRFFNYTFGTYGIFLYQPFLLIPLLNLRNYKERKFIYIFCILLLNLILNTLLQKNYGGSAFGPRRLIPLIPLFLIYTIIEIKSFKEFGRLRKTIVIVLLSINVVVSFIGATNPWENWNVNINDSNKKEFYFPLYFTTRKLLYDFKII